MDMGTASYGILPENVRTLRPAEQVPNKIDINALFAAFQQLSDQNDNLMKEVLLCRAELSEARKVIEKVASEVMPAITELTNGPIGAILGMKKAGKK